MLLSSLFVSAALAAPLPQEKIGFARRMLDEQTNSSGWPWRPHYPENTKPYDVVGGSVINPPQCVLPFGGILSAVCEQSS